MSIRFQFNRAKGILIAQVEGPLTDQSLIEVSHAIRKQLVATNARAGIFDFTGVTDFEVTTELVQRFTRNGSAAFQGIQGVVVVPLDVAYGLARMFQIMTEQTLPRFSAVKTMDEAIESLRAEGANFEQLDDG